MSAEVIGRTHTGPLGVNVRVDIVEDRRRLRAELLRQIGRRDEPERIAGLLVVALGRRLTVWRWRS